MCIESWPLPASTGLGWPGLCGRGPARKFCCLLCMVKRNEGMLLFHSDIHFLKRFSIICNLLKYKLSSFQSLPIFLFLPHCLPPHPPVFFLCLPASHFSLFLPIRFFFLWSFVSMYTFYIYLKQNLCFSEPRFFLKNNLGDKVVIQFHM